MAERAAECVACPEAADDVDGHGRHEGTGACGRGDVDAVAAELDDRQLQAALEQPLCRLLVVAGPDCDLALDAVADRRGHMVERRADLTAAFLRGGPEHRAPVEIEDRVLAPPAGIEAGVHGGARGLVREARSRDP